MAANITYRASSSPTIPGATSVKGAPLTNLEVDANFRALGDDIGNQISTERSTTTTLVNKTLTAPILTGIPVAPTAPSGTNTTQLATTAFTLSAASDAAIALGIALG